MQYDLQKKNGVARGSDYDVEEGVAMVTSFTLGHTSLFVTTNRVGYYKLAEFVYVI